jgi:hypothetical protein
MPSESLDYWELIPGERYEIQIYIVPDNEVFAGNYPYNGIFVGLAPGTNNPMFRDVTTARGKLLGEKTYDISAFAFNEFIGPGGPRRPRPWPQRNIPAGTNDIVNQDTITEGMDMVDFHGEYGFDRHYPVEVYDALHPKLNPMTRRPILPSDLQYYTAHIAPAGGRRRRQTKKSKRRARKTRRRHK